MLSMTDLKTGVTINIEGAPYEVVKYQHSKMGRGGAVMRTTLKNLLTGNNIERTFRDSDKFDAADLAKSKAQFLYREGNGFVFMDSTTFDQFTIDAATIGFTSNFLTEGLEVELLMFNGNPINVNLPTKMVFTVAESEPAVKGDTANNPMKNATLETGLSVRVPMFVAAGDKLVIDTRDGAYVERAK